MAVDLAASVAGGAALAFHLWSLFWAAVAIVVVSIPVGKMIRIMDDTISWGQPPPLEHQSPGGSARRVAPRGQDQLAGPGSSRGRG